MATTRTQGTLSRLLAKAYPQQAKNWDKGRIYVQIDDRDRDDTYSGFCDIHLQMDGPDANQFTLTLDNVPFDDDVKEVAGELEGIWHETRTGQRLTLNLTSSESALISRLATAIRQVVGRGQCYEDPNWKWIARRTSKSLERLAGILSKFGT